MTILNEDNGRAKLNTAGSLVALGLVAILGFLSWALVFKEIPQNNQNVLTVVVGILSAQIGVIVGYFFGTTVSTRKQDDSINKLATTAAQATERKQPKAIRLGPGETAVTKPTPAGTVVEKERDSE